VQFPKSRTRRKRIAPGGVSACLGSKTIRKIQSRECGDSHFGSREYTIASTFSKASVTEHAVDDHWRIEAASAILLRLNSKTTADLA
jgi:hypothetical protein